MNSSSFYLVIEDPNVAGGGVIKIPIATESTYGAVQLADLYEAAKLDEKSNVLTPWLLGEVLKSISVIGSNGVKVEGSLFDKSIKVSPNLDGVSLSSTANGLSLTTPQKYSKIVFDKTWEAGDPFDTAQIKILDVLGAGESKVYHYGVAIGKSVYDLFIKRESASTVEIKPLLRYGELSDGTEFYAVAVADNHFDINIRQTGASKIEVMRYGTNLTGNVFYDSITLPDGLTAENKGRYFTTDTEIDMNALGGLSLTAGGEVSGPVNFTVLPTYNEMPILTGVTHVIAGDGLTGGGSVSGDVTVNISASDDSLTIAADGISVATVDALDSTSASRPLSANQGKLLNEAKASKSFRIITGGGISLVTQDSSLVNEMDLSGDSIQFSVVSANKGIIVGENSIALNVIDDINSINIYDPVAKVMPVSARTIAVMKKDFDSFKTNLAGGGLTYNAEDEKYSVVSDTEGIEVLSGSIMLNTVNNLYTDSVYKPLSAQQGKTLQEQKANRSVQAIAGNGIAGGGTLGSDFTFSVDPFNSSLVFDTGKLLVNVVDSLDSTDSSLPLSANMGNQLKGEIDHLDSIKHSTVGYGLGSSVTSDLQTISLYIANDSLVADQNGLKVVVETGLASASATKALSASAGKELNDNKLGKTENAVSASKFANPMNITFNGDVATAVVNFDGSSDKTVSLTVNNDSHLHDANYFNKTLSDSRFVIKDAAANGGNQTISGNFVITGDLTVQGTTTTVTNQQVLSSDPFIILNDGGANIDGGITLQRGSEPSVQIKWNESGTKWQVTSDGVSYYDILHSGYTGSASIPIDVASVGGYGADSTGWDDKIPLNKADGTTTFGGTIKLKESDGTINSISANGAGIIEYSRPAGGNTVFRVSANDTSIAEIQALGNSQGTGSVYVGESSQYGGGLVYNGDDNPDLPFSTDKVTLFRRDANTSHPVIEYAYNSNDVNFYGKIKEEGALLSSKYLAINGNASTASKLVTARTITLNGDVAGSASFDGASNVTVNAVVANNSHEHIWSNITDKPTAFAPVASDVQTIVGAMFSSNSESGIATSYDSVSKKISLNVNDPVITLAGDLTGFGTLTNLSNLTITASVKDDSHSHTNYITSNADDNVTGNIKWADNAQIQLGADSDTVLYHSGSASTVRNFTGDINIENNSEGDDISLSVKDDAGVQRTMRLDGSGNLYVPGKLYIDGWEFSVE